MTRAVIVMALIAALAAPAEAARKGKKAPKPDPVAASYAAMPLSDRIAIQSDLVWIGEYNGIVNGEFGARAIAAVRAFQRVNGTKETGVLNPQERAALTAAAKARQEAVGWRLVDDVQAGVRLGLPAKLVPQSSPLNGGSRWSSARGEVQIETFRIREPWITLAQAFEQQKKEPATRRPSYSVRRDEFFVIAGLQELKKFYVRAHGKGNEVRGVTILYDQAMDGIMDPIVVAMSSAFIPFPTGGLAGTVPVAYGTGIVIDAAGHVVADLNVTRDCSAIILSGLGRAELVAEHKTDDLALLRVYGARNTMPLTIGKGTGNSVTLVGVADPQTQGGADTVTTMAARLGNAGDDAIRPLEPVPAAGFSGAAALGGDGRLAGIVRVSAATGADSSLAQARFIPVETVRAFLDAHAVTIPKSGRTGIEAAKAAVVRVICVRR